MISSLQPPASRSRSFRISLALLPVLIVTEVIAPAGIDCAEIHIAAEHDGHIAVGEGLVLIGKRESA